MLFVVRVHDDVIKWKHFPRYWPFVRGIPVNSLHKGQWRGALMFSLICTRINGWVNNGEAGDLRRHRAHYDVIVMFSERSRGYQGVFLREVRQGAVHMGGWGLQWWLQATAAQYTDQEAVKTQWRKRDMSPWRPLLGPESWYPIFKTIHCYAFEDRVPAMGGYPVFKWVAVTD